MDYFKLGFEKGIFRSGKNNLRYKSDSINVQSSLSSDCHVIDDNNISYNTVIDWIKHINNNNNIINWKNLYYNDKNLSDYEDMILNETKEKLEEDDDDDNEIREQEEDGNNNKYLYYSNNRYRNETRPPESCYYNNYNNDISSGSDKSDDNNNNNNINKLPSDDDDNSNNNMYYSNIQEKLDDFDYDYSFGESNKETKKNEFTDDLHALIKQNQISPGVDILELRHNGCCYRGSLMKNGKIRSSDGLKFVDMKSWSKSLTSETLGISDLLNSVYYKSCPISAFLCELKN